MMMRRRCLIVGLTLLLSAACVRMNRTVTPPPSANGIGGQIISRQIDDHTWRIYWADTVLPFEDRQTEEDYFLYRAAELTVEKGFDWFSIAGQHVQMFKGVAPADVLGTYDARQVTRFVGSRVVLQGAAAPTASRLPQP